MTYIKKNSMSNNSKGSIDPKAYKLAKIENQLKTQLINNDEETVKRIIGWLEEMNINVINHEANEHIRYLNRIARR